MPKLKAAIVGAGRIGAFFDTPQSKYILTHAHAYFAHPKFEIAAFADINFRKAKKAALIWGGRAYQNIDDLFRQEDIDVVSVCVPDGEHFSTLCNLKTKNFIGGVLEKPLTDSLPDSEHLLADPFFRRRKFLVNYHRRYISEFQAIKRKIDSGEYGKFIAGSGYYGKGLLHNASHLLDILFFWGFKVENFKVISSVKDFYPKDPSRIVALTLRHGGVFNLNVVSGKLYKIVEMDFCFEKARLRILDGGLEIEEYKVKDDPVFKGYKIPILRRRYKTKLARALYYTVDNLYYSIRERGAPLCTMQDAYDVQKLCEEIKQS